jgi:hypothetical protein
LIYKNIDKEIIFISLIIEFLILQNQAAIKLLGDMSELPLGEPR